MTDELPPTWATTTVGTVSSGMQYGYTASASDVPCGPRFLRITDIQDGSVEWSNVPYCEIDQEAVPKYAVQDGDLLVARTGGTVGKSFLIREPPEAAVFASYLIRISPSQAIDPRYLAHYFQSAAYWQQIGLKKGGLLGNVNSTTLASVELPLGPKPEQQRIVSKIDELFSRIDEGERALARVSMLVERYRQSVLKAAVTGELTREWREKNKDKLGSGEALLARILKTRREAWEKAELSRLKAKGITPANDKWKQKYVEPAPPDTTDLAELPDGWAWASLEQLSTKIVDGTHHTPEYQNDGVPFLSVKDVRHDTLHFDDCKYISAASHRQLCNRCNPQRGDLLVTKSGTIGRSAVVQTDDAFSLFVSVALIKPVSGVSSDHLKLGFDGWFQTVNVANDITGTAVKNLHLIDLKQVCVPMMSLAEQGELRSRSAELRSRVNAVFGAVGDESRRSQALRQTVLKSAFGGCLVHQNPTDEPATALLERIAAERGTDKAAPKRGRKKKAII